MTRGAAMSFVRCILQRLFISCSSLHPSVLSNNNHDDNVITSNHLIIMSEVSKDFVVCVERIPRDELSLTQQFLPVPNSQAQSRPSASLLYHGTTHPSFRDVSITVLLSGISPLLFRVQQPPLSQSGATTANHGLRVPHLSKRRRDRR